MRTAVMVLLLFFLLSGTALQRVLEDDLQDAIALVVEYHPALVAQRAIVDATAGLSLPKSRFPISLSFSSDLGTEMEDGELRLAPALGVSLSLPLVDPDRSVDRLQTEVTWERRLQEDSKELQKLTETYISRFTAKVAEILRLQHRYAGQVRLYDLLVERREQYLDLVKAGAIQPDAVWQLDERITEVEVEMADLQAEYTLTVQETARNFAGTAWRELRDLLEAMTGDGEGRFDT